MAQDIFSVIAMFILFREALEASIVVAILLQMCDKLRLKRLKKQVWAGAISGVGIAVILGVAFIISFYTLRTRVFSGDGQNIFKGYINLIAAVLITLLAFAMLRFMNYEEKWRRKLEAKAKNIDTDRSSRWTFFLLALTTTLREGIETVIFLGGVSGSVPIRAIPLAGIVGFILGVICGLILYFTGRKIASLKWFFWLSTILLFAIAAGLVSTGMTAWQYAGWWGTTAPPYDTPWWNRPLWDWSGCCPDDVTQGSAGQFFGLMRALFGYQAKPTFISVFSYFAFWLLVAFCFVIKWRRGTLLDARAKQRRREQKQALLAHEGGGGGPPGGPKDSLEDPMRGDSATGKGTANGAPGPKPAEDDDEAPSVLPHGFHPLHHGTKAHGEGAHSHAKRSSLRAFFGRGGGGKGRGGPAGAATSASAAGAGGGPPGGQKAGVPAGGRGELELAGERAPEPREAAKL